MACDLIAEKSGWPALGLIPFFADAARLPAEDAMALARRDNFSGGKTVIAVRCCRASAISTISTR